MLFLIIEKLFESEYEHHIWYFTENENVETMKNFMEKYYG